MRSDLRPPGPKERFPGEQLFAFSRDPTGFLARLAKDYGDVVGFRAGRLQVAFLNRPDLVKDVLVTRHRDFIQGPGHREVKRLMREAVLAADGDDHLRKRRLLQPVFHRRHIETFGAAIAQLTAEHSQQWRDGATIDLAYEMWRLTLRISAKTLFGTQIEAEAQEIHEAVDDLLSMFNPVTVLLADWLTRVPSLFRSRFHAARSRLDRKMDRLIAEHRASGDGGDLLSLLLSAYAEDSRDGHGDGELRDETLEMFLAAHGTIALALTWTLYLLALHPETEARLLAELNGMRQKPTPTMEDVTRLTYTRMALQEGMRLYPPTWVTDRQLVVDYPVAGYCLPAGSVVLVSPWTMHRDSRYFPDPLRFEPERWTAARVTGLPDFAYFPFGGGPHMCPGEALAWFEGILMLATIVPRWKMHPLPNPLVQVKPRFSLETKNGICMKLERRNR